MKILVDARLWEHPKLARLAELLGRNPTEAGGYLCRLWSMTAEYRTGGSLLGLGEREVCSLAGWMGSPKKFVTALRKSGWLDHAEVHDWQEHQGKYIAKMMRERERKRRAYSAEAPRENAPPGSVSVSGSVTVSGEGKRARAARGAPGAETPPLSDQGTDGTENVNAQPDEFREQLRQTINQANAGTIAPGEEAERQLMQAAKRAGCPNDEKTIRKHVRALRLREDVGAQMLEKYLWSPEALGRDVWAWVKHFEPDARPGKTVKALPICDECKNTGLVDLGEDREPRYRKCGCGRGK